MLDEIGLELLASAWDDQINLTLGADHLEHLIAIGAQHRDGAIRHARACERGHHHITEDAVGAGGDAAATKHDRIAALQSQRRGIGRDVGPAFIDDPDHTQRHTRLEDLEPVGHPPPRIHDAHGVGQGGNCADALCHGIQPRVVEQQAVHHRGGGIGLPGGLHILGILGDDLGRSRGEGPRHGLQRVHLVAGAHHGQCATGRPCGREAIVQ